MVALVFGGFQAGATGALRGFANLTGRHRTVLFGASMMLALRIIEKLAGLVASVFIFRTLDSHTVGEFSLVQTVVALCSVFGVQSFQDVVTQSVARGTPGTYRATLFTSLTLSGAGIAAILVVAIWFWLAGQGHVAGALLAGAVLFLPSQGLNQWRGLLLGRQEYRRFAIAESLNAILRAALVVLALLLGWTALWVLVVMSYVFPALQNMLRTFAALREVPRDAPSDPASIAYGLKAGVWSVFTAVAQHIDKLLLFALLSPPVLAVYVAALRFGELAESVPQDIAAALAAKFAVTEKYSERLHRIVLAISAAVGAALVVFAFTLLGPAVILLFGDAYSVAVPYAQVLVLAAAFRGVISFQNRFIRSRLDSDSLRRLALFGSGGKVALSVVLVPLFGLPGAVASVFLHRVLTSVLVSRIIRQKYRE